MNMRFIEDLRDRTGLAQWASIPLRLIVGYGFFVHGLTKLEKGPENFVIHSGLSAVLQVARKRMEI
jgi:uncharacterized membrane protein YphA (DoxX/SURF4 family)